MTKKQPTVGKLLVQSAREAAAIAAGEAGPARRVRYRISARAADAAPPPRYDAARVKAVRERLDLSQSVFARALNVSPETVRAWEQGKRTPDGASLRLLEVAEGTPRAILRYVKPRQGSRAGTTAKARIARRQRHPRKES